MALSPPFFLNKTRTMIQFKIMLYLQKCMKSQLIKNRWSPEHAGAIFFVSLVEVEEERFRLLHLLAGCHQVFKKSSVESIRKHN